MRKVTTMKHIGAILASCVSLLGMYAATAQEQRKGRQDSGEAVVFEGKTLQEWVELLRGDDPDAHLRAARALVEVGEPAYYSISEALSNSYDPIWKHTVEALVRIGEPAVPALLAAIRMEGSGDLRHNGGVAALQKMGAAAHPALKKALDDKDSAVRMSAAIALRLQMMGRGQDAVIKLLADALRTNNDVRVRMLAVEALGFSGMTPPSAAAVNAIIPALNDPDDDVGGTAAVSLVRLNAWRGKNVVPALIKALKSKEAEGMLPSSAAEALGRLGPAAESAVPALIETMKRNEPFIADHAAEALGKIGPAAVPALREVLSTSNGAVWAHAARALGSAGPASKDTISLLLESLSQDDPSVRAAAIHGLGDARADSDEAIAALVKTLADKNRNVRNAAIRALGRIGSRAKPAVPTLAKLLAELEYFEQAAVIRALGSIGPNAKEAIPALAAAIPDGGMDAAKALGRIGPMAVPALVKALKHEESDVRQSAAWGLRYLGPDAREAVPALAALITPNEKACSFAIQALGAIGPDASPAVPALVTVLRDGDQQLHYCTLQALREIGPSAKAAKAAVLAAMQTDDRESRWAAATALIAMGELSEAMPVILNALVGNNAYYNIGASEILIEAGPAAKMAAPTLAKIMNDEGTEPYLRISCAKALAQITPTDKRGITFLRDQLGRPDGPLALSAAFTLVELGEADDAVVDVLKPGLASEHPGKIIACAGALASVPSQRNAAIVLLRAKVREKDKKMRVTAALALTKAGVADPQAIDILSAQLRLEDGSGRAIEAIEALAVIAGEDKRAQAILTEALHHETDAVHEAARRALSEIPK